MKNDISVTGQAIEIELADYDPLNSFTTVVNYPGCYARSGISCEMAGDQERMNNEPMGYWEGANTAVHFVFKFQLECFLT